MSEQIETAEQADNKLNCDESITNRINIKLFQFIKLQKICGREKSSSYIGDFLQSHPEVKTDCVRKLSLVKLTLNFPTSAAHVPKAKTQDEQVVKIPINDFE